MQSFIMQLVNAFMLNAKKIFLGFCIANISMIEFILNPLTSIIKQTSNQTMSEVHQVV